MKQATGATSEAVERKSMHVLPLSMLAVASKAANCVSWKASSARCAT